MKKILAFLVRYARAHGVNTNDNGRTQTLRAGVQNPTAPFSPWRALVPH